MKKRRKHKAKRKQPPPQQLPRASSTPQPPLPKYPRKRHWWEWLVGALALTASVVGILLGFDWARDQYEKTDPEISIVDSDPVSPFLFPFSVRNESPFFAMTDVNWACSISDLVTRGGFVIHNVSMAFTGSTKKIATRSAANFKCPIDISAAFTVLKIQVRVDFKSLGKPRHTEKPFTWIATAIRPRWIEGD